LTFGGGIHSFLRALLARAEMAEALPILAARLCVPAYAATAADNGQASYPNCLASHCTELARTTAHGAKLALWTRPQAAATLENSLISRILRTPCPGESASASANNRSPFSLV
jgi:hypothetical protein